MGVPATVRAQGEPTPVGCQRPTWTCVAPTRFSRLADDSASGRPPTGWTTLRRPATAFDAGPSRVSVGSVLWTATAFAVASGLGAAWACRGDSLLAQPVYRGRALLPAGSRVATAPTPRCLIASTAGATLVGTTVVTWLRQRAADHRTRTVAAATHDSDVTAIRDRLRTLERWRMLDSQRLALLDSLQQDETQRGRARTRQLQQALETNQRTTETLRRTLGGVARRQDALANELAAVRTLFLARESRLRADLGMVERGLAVRDVRLQRMLDSLQRATPTPPTPCLRVVADARRFGARDASRCLLRAVEELSKSIDLSIGVRTGWVNVAIDLSTMIERIADYAATLLEAPR